MNRVVPWLTAALLATLILAPSVHAAAPSSPFTGEWIGADPAPPDGDGSVLHLVIGPGPRPAISFVDEFGSVCVNFGSPVTVFDSRLTGVVDGDLLWATFRTARCGPVPLLFLTGEPVLYELDDQGNADPADDVLFDGFTSFTRA